MMQKRIRLALVLLSLPMLVLATVNCGTSPAALCSRTKTTITAKVGSCGGVTYEESDQKKCEETIDQCSADDRTKIAEALDCMDKIEACVSGNELAFLASFGNCSAAFGNLSANCKAAFEFGND